MNSAMGKRKKTISVILSVILSVFLLIPNISYSVQAKDVMTLNAGSAVETEVRAVWFSFRDWQKYLQGKDKAAFNPL